jgi:hypothetical protein
VNLPDNPVEQWDFQNVNLIGIGFLDGVDGMDVNFRGLVSLSTSLTVAYDATNHVITIDFDSAQLIADLPDATTTQRGVLETATDAEAIAKAANNKIITPSNFAAMGSTSTFAGLIEIATNAEAAAGISTTLAITPASLAFVLSTISDTKTFADAATRAGTVPDFVGQFGGQQDLGSAWVSYGLGAGQWNPILTLNTSNDSTSVQTSVEFTNGTFVFDGGTTGFLIFTDLRMTMPLGTFVDWTGATWKNGGVTVPADSVMITNAVAGTPSSALRSTFLSTFATQAGYTAISNPATIRTFDSATVTLQQLAQAWGTLVEDLKAVLLPAT